MLILGVSGKAGSGKDTVCDYLSSRYGFQKLSLAAPLKEIVSRVFPKIPRDNLWGPSPLREEPVRSYRMSGSCPVCGAALLPAPEGQVCGGCGGSWPEYLTARVALQTLGTDWGRRLYPDVWVDYLFDHLPEETQRVCVSDVRFPNEVRAIVRNGGKVLRLLRDKSGSSSHDSETSLDEVEDNVFDGLIRNESTLEELHRSVDKFIDRVTLNFR